MNLSRMEIQLLVDGLDLLLDKLAGQSKQPGIGRPARSGDDHARVIRLHDRLTLSLGHAREEEP